MLAYGQCGTEDGLLVDKLMAMHVYLFIFFYIYSNFLVYISFLHVMAKKGTKSGLHVKLT